MKKVYACLVGNWVCLNDDPDCKIGDGLQRPDVWIEEDSSVFAPANVGKENENKYTALPYVNIHYRGIDYRINPIFIQITTE